MYAAFWIKKFCGHENISKLTIRFSFKKTPVILDRKSFIFEVQYIV